MRHGKMTQQGTKPVCPNCGALEAFLVDVSEIVTWTINQLQEGWKITEHSHHDSDVHFESVFCPYCHTPLADQAKQIARRINLI